MVLHGGGFVPVVLLARAGCRFSRSHTPHDGVLRCAGWAVTRTDGIEHLQPSPSTTTPLPPSTPLEFPWQRYRDSGLLYEDVLKKRKVELTGDISRLTEWNTLIAELDAVVRRKHGLVARVREEGRSATPDPVGTWIHLEAEIEACQPPEAHGLCRVQGY